MPGRRKPTLLLQGKPRKPGGATRPWRVRLYAPEPGGSRYQIMFRAPATEGDPWKRVLRRANSEREARAIFDQAESALDAERETPARADIRAARTVRALGEAYLRDSRDRGKQPRTMEQRESRLNAHILPTIGEVPVAKWRVQHSRNVMDKGGKTIFSSRRREDLRGQLAAMRKLAWRLGWLDRNVDPLDGLEIARHTVLHGASTQYVDPRLRPESRQVHAMANAADQLCGSDGSDPGLTRLPLLGAKIRVAGFGGLRLGEQDGLRAIDLFFDRGYAHVNGFWITPRRPAGYRGPVKNNVLHEVPLPRSLMHNVLLPRVKELLQLPEHASLQQVINAQDTERRRREELAARQPDGTLGWWNVPVPAHEELWLFIDTVTRLPVRPELHNERWHRIRTWVDENDSDNSWPRTIVYRNLRHHAATKWFHDELGEPWEVVAYYLGDKLTTVVNHYVRAGEDALRTTVGKLENY